MDISDNIVVREACRLQKEKHDNILHNLLILESFLRSTTEHFSTVHAIRDHLDNLIKLGELVVVKQPRPEPPLLRYATAKEENTKVRASV